MRLTNVSFNEHEEPQEVAFVMTVDEAALLYAFAGRVSPKDVADAAGEQRWGNVLFDVGDCLSGFFNRFWDGGASEVAPSLAPRLGPEGTDGLG